MDIQITGNQIIEKLTKRISQDAQTIAALECTIEILKEEISRFQEESTLKLK